MTSAALILCILWQRTPLLSLALAGPLLAIGLYQRSTFKAMQAMRLALTDPLTGLGNHRSFHERLQRELVAAEHAGTSVALCLFDLDDLKTINDQHGHPMGDAVLSQVASRLRQGGEAFRLGGDEFAVLLPGHDEREASAVARSIVERIAALRIEGIDEVTVSGGVATFPTHGAGRDELIRLADSALYWAKEDGKNRVRAYAAESFLRANLEQLADSPDRAARYRAAESLAQTVDARDAYNGRHSQRVGEYAARIARRLGADEPTIELIRLGGSLHDLGKLAIPEELLRKPTALSDAERLVLERHPQIGYRMLESLGVDAGGGVRAPSPRAVGRHRLSRTSSRGEQIPLAARIVFVADAYDAMTAARGPRATAARPRRRRSRSSSAARARSSTRASSRRSRRSCARAAAPTPPSPDAFRNPARRAGRGHDEEQQRVPGMHDVEAEPRAAAPPGRPPAGSSARPRRQRAGAGRPGRPAKNRPRQEDRRQVEPVTA